jgi:hypothetical protein
MCNYFWPPLKKGGSLLEWFGEEMPLNSRAYAFDRLRQRAAALKTRGTDIQKLPIASRLTSISYNAEKVLCN